MSQHTKIKVDPDRASNPHAIVSLQDQLFDYGDIPPHRKAYVVEVVAESHGRWSYEISYVHRNEPRLIHRNEGGWSSDHRVELLRGMICLARWLGTEEWIDEWANDAAFRSAEVWPDDPTVVAATRPSEV